MRKKIKFIELNLKATTMNIPVTFLYFYMYKYMYIFEKIVKSLSRVRLFPTPWTVVCQAPLSTGIIQAGILEWVAIFFSRRSSQPRDQTRVSHLAGRLFTLEPQGKPNVYLAQYIIRLYLLIIFTFRCK